MRKSQLLFTKNTHYPTEKSTRIISYHATEINKKYGRKQKEETPNVTKREYATHLVYSRIC